MKTRRSHEFGLIVAGMLCGFAIGIYTYLALFILPGETRNGVAMLIASIFGLAGSVWMAIIRAEARREDKANAKSVA